MLRHQVGIDPDRVGPVLDLAAVGIVVGRGGADAVDWLAVRIFHWLVTQAVGYQPA